MTVRRFGYKTFKQELKSCIEKTRIGGEIDMFADVVPHDFVVEFFHLLWRAAPIVLGM